MPELHDQCEGLLRARLGDLAEHDVASLVAAMLAFYRDVRFDVRPLDEGGDGLLFQWGVYDWGEGEHFELDITRQLLLESEEEPWHLHLTMRFPALETYRALGEESEWCFHPEGLGSFEALIAESMPMVVLSEERPDTVEIRYEAI